MKQCLIFAAAIILVFSAGTPMSAQDRNSNVAALRNADAQWARVFTAHDLKQSVDACTTDASVMAPNAPAANGREAITELFKGFFATPDFKISWHATGAEVADSGELGYSTGVYEMSFKVGGDKMIKDHGKYLTLWRKQKDGSWKVISDIFNSDLPPATP
jgi:ketosteroid isomerase-like protein